MQHHRPDPALSVLATPSNHPTVLNITLSNHTLRLSYRGVVAYQCYLDVKPIANESGSSGNELAGPGFALSLTANRLVAIGCDTIATVRDAGSQLDVTGCMTFCPSLDSVRNLRACSGRGCCESPVFDTMSRPRIQLSSLNNHSFVQGFNPCSFAFLGEVGSYPFSPASLRRLDYDNISVPVVYDWSVSTSFRGSCLEVNGSRKGSVMCGPNTNCVDAEDGRGYICECRRGFDGNPYLSQGCQDIDECEDASLNDCEIDLICVDHDCQIDIHCENKIGGYVCKCPKGYVGNATQTSPCAPPPQTHGVKLILGLSLGIGLLSALIIFMDYTN